MAGASRPPASEQLPDAVPAAAPKVVVVMPAYDAGKTLRLTYEQLPKDHVSLVILVDDGSTDHTLDVARELPSTIPVIEPSAARCWKRSRSRSTRMASCSTRRSLPR